MYDSPPKLRDLYRSGVYSESTFVVIRSRILCISRVLSMPDSFSSSTRSRIMSGIKSKGTKPEIQVRRLLHNLGYRYRLHRADLPGRPDLVFPSRRKVVFVNGCFWHNHPGCARAHIPSGNKDYWLPKLTNNRERDERNVQLLKEKGWGVMTVWECQLKDMSTTSQRLTEFLEQGSPNQSKTDKKRPK